MLEWVPLAWLWLAAPAPPPQAAFRPLAREVTNWREQASFSLDLPPLSALSLQWGIEANDAAGALRAAAGEGKLSVARCVRLNNYWCIKRAGWAGEIAADAEGHVAFASAAEGALVAASLLRRYYVDFRCHSAMEIVSRWAPAQCGLGGPTVAGLARRGLGLTMRAQWLARAHRLRGRPVAARRSVVKARFTALARAPAIAVGLGETTLIAPAVSLTSALAAAPLREPAPLGATCASESARILNYARAASQGAAANEHADLALFDSSGAPTPNLARVMGNMAGVEIGPLRARDALVQEAVEALARRVAPPTN